MCADYRWPVRALQSRQAMASKPWSLMYALARLENAVEHAVQHLSASTSATYPAAVRAGFNALKTKELTTIVCMSGTAMLPTLNRYSTPRKWMLTIRDIRCT